jgi:hypothetical protein
MPSLELALLLPLSIATAWSIGATKELAAAGNPADFSEIVAHHRNMIRRCSMTRNVSNLCVKRAGREAFAVRSAVVNTSCATAVTTLSLIASAFFATIASFVSTIFRTRR